MRGAEPKPMRVSPLSRHLAALFLVLLSSFAAAGIKESKEWIVDSRTHKFLKTLAENAGTEDTVLPKGRAVASLSIGGCNLNVLVVGPIEGDAKAYARTIDAWRAAQGFDGDVLWSQEDDCAAASYRYHPGRVGLSQAMTTIDLPSLREALLKVEPHTQFAVSDAVWSNADLGFAPDATSAQGSRFWNLTAPRPGLRPATGSIVLRPWVLPLMAIWFLLPVVGVFGSFAAGVAVAKSPRLPIPHRRKLYGKIVLGGVYGTLGLHAVLFIATVPTRLFDPLTQLWFGQRFTQLAVMIVPAFALVPMLALPFVNPIENRLMGPTAEEREAQEAAKLPEQKLSKPNNRRLLAIVLPLIAIGFGLQVYATSLPKNAPNRELLKLCAIPIMFLPVLATTFLAKKPKVIVEPGALDELEARLRDRVAAMAARLNMEAPPSRVLTDAIYGRFGAVLDKKGIGVTIGALESLSPGEVDFLVAHELAHEKLGHLRKRRLSAFVTMAICLLPAAILLATGRRAFSTPGFVFTPALIPLAVIFPAGFMSRRAMRRQEFQADRLAVEATGDPQSARDALRKVALNSPTPGVHDTDTTTHPTIQARLDAIV